MCCRAGRLQTASTRLKGHGRSGRFFSFVLSACDRLNREDAGAKLQPAEKKTTSVSVAKVRSIKFGGIGEDAYVYREIRKAFD